MEVRGLAANRVFPYYHPTTVVFVDDNLDFLGNLSLQLDADLAYRLFESPNKALDHLNNTARSRPLCDRFFTADGQSESVVRLDMAAIEREMRNTHRFGETSVVMVDYAMPNMNGVEFCKRIQNPHVKKILFTGVADEYVAVRAFNEGLIDRFILKSERDVYEQVNLAIRDLQRAYVRDTSYTISHVLSLRSHDTLVDPVFAGFFNDLRDEHGFIEYYMSVAPDGFLLLDSDGRASRLVVLTEEDLKAHRRIARERDAPPDLLDALARDDRVAFFDDSADGFYQPGGGHWSGYLYPAQVLEGRQRYHWALLSNVRPRMGGEVASFNAYLDWLDTTGYALI